MFEANAPVIIHVIIALIASIVIGVLMSFGLSVLGFGVGGATAGAFMAAILLAAFWFVREHGRSPSEGERLKFAFGLVGTNVLLGLSVLTLILSLPGNGLTDLIGPRPHDVLFSSDTMAVGAALIGLYWLVAYYCFRWLAKIQLWAMALVARA